MKPPTPSRRRLVSAALVALSLTSLMSAAIAWSQPKPTGCALLPDHAKLRAALQAVMKLGKTQTTGLGNPRWTALVNRDGIVCAVGFSGESRSDQWPGSRAIAAEKASTSNALSKPDFALSTGNLYFSAQPGQSLYSLTTSAPPNPDAIYGGNPAQFGQPSDPMVGKPVGGLIVFGGGLPLYDHSGQLIGGLGVSGDTSCADHVVAWKMRHALGLDAVPAGVAPGSNDNLIFDLQHGSSPSGYGHPVCKDGAPSQPIIEKLPQSDPIAKKS
jgi:uncharacterized protein GlcG (DUF336 family)